MALSFPRDPVRVPAALRRDGPFTRQPCWKMELLSSGQQGRRKIFQLKIDWGLVIYVNVFSFKHGAGDFSSITNYSLKNARRLASHKERNSRWEKLSDLLHVVYILIFVDSLPSQSVLQLPLCLTYSFSFGPSTLNPTPLLPPT